MRTPERRLLLFAFGVRIVPTALIFGTDDVGTSATWSAGIPHAGYAHAYGGAADPLYTALDRLVLWSFFSWWWLVTLIRTARNRRSPELDPVAHSRGAA